MTLEPSARAEIERVAKQVRVDTIQMTSAAGCGHPGGPLGMADFMATLFVAHLNLNVDNLHAPDRDRVILGNGHTCAGLYSLLSQKGTIPREELLRFRKLGSPLQGHPHRNPEFGIDMSTGSLGNGLSVGVGMALASRLNNWNNRIYVTSSDGESQEGQIWEAATSGAHFQTGNLTVLVDFNNIQIDGVMREVMNVRDLREKYAAFGWHAVEIDGHDIDAVDAGLTEAREVRDRPSAIICRTVLGKGVSFMENQAKWHGVAPNEEESKQALAELNA